LTKDELAKYDGSEGSPGIYLALLGQVFDVSKSPKFYGPDGGYGFFSAKDGSRAFISGNFDQDGLTDDVEGLSNSDYLGLEEWISFYHKVN
jgi:predicted heme/steroid binding protein